MNILRDSTTVIEHEPKAFILNGYLAQITKCYPEIGAGAWFTVNQALKKTITLKAAIIYGLFSKI